MSIFINQQHGWIFLLLAAAAVLGVVWFYRRVPPSVGGRLRMLLAVLRSAALVMLLVALVEPVVALTRTFSERPVVGVLLDVSESMSIADGTGGQKRGDEALVLLNEVVLPRVARDSEIEAFSFAADLASLPVEGGGVGSSPSFEAEVTDMGRAFDSLGRELSGRNLRAVVVATDGANNRGASPYGPGLALAVPVFTLGVGSEKPSTDIAVEEAVTNRISYTGEKVPVEVTVSSAGFAGAETSVELYENGSMLDAALIDLSGTGEETRVVFSVTPVTPGVHRYTVSIPVAPGEISEANNTRVIATTAMKGKLRCLLVASRPSWDYAFLRRELEADANMDLTALVQLGGAPGDHAQIGAPASRADLFEYDLLVLVEPDWSGSAVRLDWIDAFVRDRGGGLLVVGVPGPFPGGSGGDLLPLLPVEASQPTDTRVALTERGETAPVTRVVADRYENAGVWSSLPPVRTAAGVRLSARAGVEVLVEGLRRSGETVPFVATHRVGAGGVMMIAGDGLWRWKMADSDESDIYDRLIGNVARWLTARGELDRVVVSTDKDVYSAGEEVRISAQVYGGDFRLAADAAVTIDVSSRENAVPVTSLTLEPDGDFYRGSVRSLEPGSYLIKASATINGEEAGEADGQLVVDSFSLEDAEIRRRSAVLARLSDESGGGYYTPETVGSMPDDVQLSRNERTRRSEHEVWNSPWLLLFAAGLLSSEWALRRKQGLP